ncbi:hypothetical protein [Botrimarina mediterranea]|uniref:ABC-2 family transporter protein n=1 Tax=Botrimarina mediterranea TaxID=2528022 RepID=A0A518KDV8_9BACT|nr:hypothetical protein [Botrimarina mediterranea]QDV75971.1 hypothetical protein Spa11_41940 [Botrimarina mediterranea]
MPTATALGAPNTLRLAKRFFWKECRRLSVLAAGVSVLAMGLMLLVWWFTPRSVDPADPLSVIAVGAGMMLAVAAAATLFSVEKEEGTAELLERLPRNVLAMTIGKIGSASVIIPLCTLALLLLAFVIGGDIADSQQIPVNMAPRVSLFLLEAFVWSLVASLACPNPLVAAVLGIALGSVSLQLGIFATIPSVRGFTPAGLDAAAPARLALAGVGMLVAGWLVSGWPAPLRRRRAVVAADVEGPSRRRHWLPSLGWGLFGRYFWQTLRQSWATGVVAMLLGLFLTFISVLIPEGLLEANRTWRFFSGVGLLFAPALLGAVVFRADQRRDAYRFLAEHAGRPRMLWLARNLVGLAILGLFTALLVAVFLGVWLFMVGVPGRIDFVYQYSTTAGVDFLRVVQGLIDGKQLAIVAATAVLTAYAYGQFFSLALRSDVIAAMLALVASIVVLGWSSVVLAWELPPLAFLLPLAIGALLAAWLRVSDWMFDRRGWWRWAAPVAALLAPAACLLPIVPAERLAQVNRPTPLIATSGLVLMHPEVRVESVPPQVGSWHVRSGVRFDELVSQTQEEMRKGKEVADAYARLEAEEVAFDEVEDEGDEEPAFDFGLRTVIRPAHGRLDGDALDAFLRLSRVRCRLMSGHGGDLQKIALMDSTDAEEPIDLDGRLERLLACRRVSIQGGENLGLLHEGSFSVYLADEFVDWANEEGQTPERIGKAIRGLREAEAMSVGPIGHLMNDRYQAQAIINGEASPQFLQGTDPRPRVDQWLAYLANESLDFERERALQALDLLAAYDAAYLGEGMRALTSNKPALNWLQRYSIDDAQLVGVLAPDVPQHGAYYFGDLTTIASARTSRLVSQVFNNQHVLSDALRRWMAGVAWRRAERVRLALIAYHLEHDEYPESLEPLVGSYLGREEIRDPYTGEPFGWKPDGFDLPLAEEYRGEIVKQIAPIGIPALWCGGGALAAPVKRQARVGKPGAGGVSDDNRPTATVMSLQPVEEIYFWPTGAFWMPAPK